MNGIHDMGGMEGFGPVQPEPNEPPFHSNWEARALAMNRAMSYAKVWNIDKSRAAIEELPPHDYLTMTYYEKWALRLEKLLLEFGLVGADEIAAGHALRPGKPFHAAAQPTKSQYPGRLAHLVPQLIPKPREKEKFATVAGFICQLAQIRFLDVQATFVFASGAFQLEAA